MQPRVDTDTGALIRRLTGDVAPVQRVPPLRMGMARTFAAWGATAAVLVLCIGPWPRALVVVSGHFDSALVLMGLAALGAGALLYAMAATVPGRESAGRFGLGLAGAGVVALISAVLGGHFAPAGRLYLDHPLRWDLVCIGYATLAALPTAVVAVRICLRGAPWHRHATALTLALGSTALGAGLVQALCGEGSARHTIGSHVLAPPLAMAVLAVAVLIDRARGAARRAKDRRTGP